MLHTLFSRRLLFLAGWVGCWVNSSCPDAGVEILPEANLNAVMFLGANLIFTQLCRIQAALHSPLSSVVQQCFNNIGILRSIAWQMVR